MLQALEEHGGGPLPAALTPHSLRRTFASILVALGDDPAYVIGQLGHTDPSLTLRLYAREMARRDGERERLRARRGPRVGTNGHRGTVAAETQDAPTAA